MTTTEVSFRFLVVDDMQINCKVMQKQIEMAAEEAECPCVCECVASGSEAVERCREHVYDLVIMDYNMPEMTGGEATRKILNISPRIHILGCTETTDLKEVADCYLSGMAEVLPKDPRKVREIVKHHMSQQGSNYVRRKKSLY